MRKPAAIFLLLIFLFNVVGYRAWFYYAEQKADRQMEASLDKSQYNDKDLLLLKVPLNMPYQLEDSRFERTDGEITLDGKIYKYVKRKVSDGNLILLCIPDQNKMNLKKAKTDFGNGANDIASSAANKKPAQSPLQKKTTVSEYEEFLIHTAQGGLSTRSTHETPNQPPGLSEAFVAFPGKPPELLA